MPPSFPISPGMLTCHPWKIWDYKSLPSQTLFSLLNQVDWASSGLHTPLLLHYYCYNNNNNNTYNVTLPKFHQPQHPHHIQQTPTSSTNKLRGKERLKLNFRELFVSDNSLSHLCLIGIKHLDNFPLLVNLPTHTHSHTQTLKGHIAYIYLHTCTCTCTISREKLRENIHSSQVRS